jgi:hypothetical protein
MSGGATCMTVRQHLFDACLEGVSDGIKYGMGDWKGSR